jgi:FecR protein
MKAGRILGASGEFQMLVCANQEAAMKTTSRTTLIVLALGMLGVSGWARAQETGAIASPTQDAVTAKVDNGAMPGDSHVRIVRLSDAKGTLALDRKTGNGFEQTMQNMPIVEGEKLQTGDGFAEVEFEDNSTLRLAPNTRVDFPLLALRSTGAKASTMTVVKGTVYVNTESTKDNEFLLEAGEAKMVVTPSTRLRLEFDGESALLAVFKGSVEVQRGTDTTVVDKKETLSLGMNEMSVTKKIAEEPYDAWDKESIDYHERYAMANANAGAGNSFGLSDLNYYGNFTNVPGYGSFWQPYFIGAGWSPYANGLWAMYPGAGYSWVSPYPWGWLPYHSGAWSFVPGLGWGWQPGGTWNGLNNVGVATAAGGILPAGTTTTTVGKPVNSPLRSAVPPPSPVTATGAVRPSLVLANDKPIVMSREDKQGNFVFQRDSAGLGVPRGSLGNLNKISNDVVRHGSANMEVYAAAPNGESHGANRGANQGPASLRPAQGSSGSSMERGPAMSSASRSGNQGSMGSQAGPASHASSAAGPATMSSPSSGGAASSSARSPK